MGFFGVQTRESQEASPPALTRTVALLRNYFLIRSLRLEYQDMIHQKTGREEDIQNIVLNLLLFLTFPFPV
jgi:hypothetical protein